jgi:cation diffusion facilitator family transporter
MLNVCLFIAKCVAASLSGSLSVVASTLDSFLDLLSGVIVTLSDKARRRTDRMKYPLGKERMETIGVLIFAVVMGMSMVTIITESVKKIIKGYDPNNEVTFSIPTIVILGCTICSKGIMSIICRCVIKSQPNPVVEAYSQDHFNDVLTNIVGTTGMIISSKFSNLWWTDPTAALGLAFYIITMWSLTAKQQIKLLTGRAAPTEVLNKLTLLAYNHDPRIVMVDTVRAYYSGNRYIVEVHVVLPEDLSLKEAHNIGEPLALKIEELESVERAFVHLDYEGDHHPDSEHKIPFQVVSKADSPKNS